ncbi:chromosomal replication initiator protein DnaA [Bosea sp. (in: a-proteobacteria)]|jgi:chromosomal replication initiator protein|uniref:chromosomal replication initiator protein DnaA n=1 Tax=Bosea sp. (in: a-proteobacteria) TaxID=1871050 RepID=UPI00273457C7|nr:chromosomal replication initiator protein DnaA [Bosea sp. (in: a-proteobacteria)]MDP3409436.1 chromosomal replication initiator protein DnaA [Bosea sp. (in: a-proteobacteria)]
MMFERRRMDDTVEVVSASVGKGFAEQARQIDEAPVVIQASAGEAWDRVRRRLRAELGEDVFSSWFARVELGSIVDGVAYLTVPTRFLKSWLESHYAERLRVNCMAELAGLNGVMLSVRQVSRDMSQPPAEIVPLRGRATVAAPTEPRPAPATGIAAAELGERDLVDACGTLLDRRMNFQAFIVGKSNQLAFAAAERIAAAPAGTTPYNPLYIHAGVGLGKTHLLQAIAQEARSQGKRVAYFTADRFMYGFVAALKSQTALAFKEKLRGIDLLVVDDVQFIQGKSIQQEFGHTINALIDAGKQIVVAGDRMANDLEALDERIRSRLGGGLVVEVGDLDEALRATILGNRLETLQAAHPNFQVNPDVVTYVARVVATNGRDLDGAANRLLAHATLSGQPVSLETAEAAIRDLVRTREPRRVKIEDIQKLVATRYNVSRADILSERRTAAVVKPRQIAMYLAKALTPRSLPEIGRRFGGRDHTTVLHAVRKIEKAITEDRSLHDEVDLLKRMLQE